MLNLTCKSAVARAQKCWSVPPRFHNKCLPWIPFCPYSSVHGRSFSQRAAFAYPRKDSQDRDSINREATEYTKSGSDDQIASIDDAAFNPNLTDPDSQRKKTGRGDVSIIFSCGSIDVLLEIDEEY